MTHEELAKHWNISLEEVKNISDFMNKNYFLCVGKNKKSGLYHGLIYKVNEKHGPMLALSSKQGFINALEASDFINNACDIIEMPDERAKLMQVPADAYKTLEKIKNTKVYSKALDLNKERSSR